MNKKNDSLFPYAYIDSQRLRETFFSPQKKRTLAKKKKNFSSNKIILSCGIALAALLVSGAFVFVFKYDFLVVPHVTIETEASLLRNPNRSSAFIIKNGVASKVKKTPLYLEIPSQENVRLRIDLKKSANISKTPIVFYLKKVNTPLKIGVVVRDTQFFSNSLNPFILELKNTGDTEYLQVPLALTATQLQNTNLSNINQISLYFYPPDKNETTAIKNWVVIKDMVLAEKEGK
ncbi:MAG: hypothetical protein PHV55_00060 [Candidatus Omnitrophica bacterium]|nr:hypothetical protein [Candidatus Omnitrophota bacterium]